MKYFMSIAVMLILTATACNNENTFDASGAFEAEEIIISSEASGAIRQLDIEEGQVLKAGQTLGYIDSTQLHLRKRQLEAQVAAVLARKPDIDVQLSALHEQLRAAEKEQKRISSLAQSNAATKKQLDDINAQVDVLRRQIAAQKSSLQIASNSITQEVAPLQVQIEQLDDQLQKCRIINPVNGTVLTQYARASEITAPGKPLYKIADLSTIILRAYISGSQLPQVRLKQKVNVLTDNGTGGFNVTDGEITWISDKAEFTPKTIQTKDERANLVYAIKVKVINDGTYKIGMYAEVNFQ